MNRDTKITYRRITLYLQLLVAVLLAASRATTLPHARRSRGRSSVCKAACPWPDRKRNPSTSRYILESTTAASMVGVRLMALPSGVGSVCPIAGSAVAWEAGESPHVSARYSSYSSFSRSLCSFHTEVGIIGAAARAT
jgi:hypothetical protein